MIALDVNNDEVVNFTNKLEKLHKSDYPIAVRGTLNDLAFDVKQKSLLRKVNKTFVTRSPGFFKKYSGVEKATGFEVNKMHSKVGIVPGNNIAAKNLEKQEKGGMVPKRSYIYMNQARVSRSHRKRVRKGNYLNDKNKVKGAPSVSRRSRASNFVAAAIVGLKFNKFVLHDTSTSKTAYLIKSISLTGKGRKRKANIRTVPIADYEYNRAVQLKPMPFLLPASKESLKNAGKYYIKNAEKRFKKRIA